MCANVTVFNGPEKQLLICLLPVCVHRTTFMQKNQLSGSFIIYKTSTKGSFYLFLIENGIKTIYVMTDESIVSSSNSVYY